MAITVIAHDAATAEDENQRRQQGQSTVIHKKFALLASINALACSLRSGWIRHYPALTRVTRTGTTGVVVLQPKYVVIASLACLLAGCANENAHSPDGMQMLGARSLAAEQEADLKRAEKQTVSARLLAAIALQRVTGRTPDPARFNELR